jgi:hypothetical protein
MEHDRILMITSAAAVLAILGGAAISAQDKYALVVPNGLAFSEFSGYEDWPVISVSQNESAIAVIVGNPEIVDAYKAGIPDNGEPFPDGVKMAKIHWRQKRINAFPGRPTVPGDQIDVDFMVKDSVRFSDSGGWGYAFFKYDPPSDTFQPRGNDAKCGFQCHTAVITRDYVFTEYAKR